MDNQKLKTKDKILNSARLLISTYGCDNTTIDDILTSAGVTKGAFYHYFKGKENLCCCVVDDVIEDYKKLARSLNNELSPFEQLHCFLLQILELNQAGHWVNCKLMLRLSSDSLETHTPIMEKVHEFWNWYISFLQNLLQQGRSQNEITKNYPANIQLHMILSLVAGSILTEQVNPGAPSPKETLNALAQMLVEKR